MEVKLQPKCVCVHAFGGFMLASRGHSSAGDSSVAVTIVLFLLWRPGQVIFVLLGAAEEKKIP